MTLSAVPVCLVGVWSVYFFHYAVYRPKKKVWLSLHQQKQHTSGTEVKTTDES
jgi:hypothetical protein